MPKLKLALQAHQAQAARHAAAVKAKERAAETYGAKKNGSGSGSSKKKQRLNELKSALHGPSTSGSAPSTSQSAVPSDKGKEKAVRVTRKPTIPFDKTDTILLLGEANFSFAHSLLLPPHDLVGCMICATSYDSEEVCYEKYTDARELVATLRSKGVKVLFNVDAGDLPKEITGNRGKGKKKKRLHEMGDFAEGDEDEGSGKWSRVIFNFPHAGAGITDQDRNILTNQHLLLRTLQSVHPILTSGPIPSIVSSTQSKSKKRKKADESDDEEDPSALDPDELDLSDVEDEYAYTPPTVFTPPKKEGTILITLLDQNPYSLWNLPKLATKPPATTPGTQLPQPRYKLLRSFEFRPEVYEGYTHRRTIGFKDGVSKSKNEEILGRKGKARTWEFMRAPKSTKP